MRGGHHDPSPPLGLNKINGGERHRLPVLAPPGWQPILNGLERFRQASDVAVPGDGEHAGEQWLLQIVDFGPPGAGMAHEGLRHRQTYGLSMVLHS